MNTTNKNDDDIVTIYFIRHAKPKEKGDDRTRPLTLQGVADATALGEDLQDQGIICPLIFSSTAARAHETARAAYPHEPILMREELYLGVGPELPEMIKATHEARRRGGGALPTVSDYVHTPEGLATMVRYGNEARAAIARLIPQTIINTVCVFGHNPLLQAIAYQLNGEEQLLSTVLPFAHELRIEIPRANLV